MALSITEAHAVNTVLRHVLGTEPRTDRLIDAAVFLADKAHSALFAGLTADVVRDALTPNRQKD